MTSHREGHSANHRATHRASRDEPHSPFFTAPGRASVGPVWHNWAGNVTAHPRLLAQPRTEAEVQETVRRAARDGLKVRVYGAGHSFTDAAATDDVLLNLDHLSGVEHFDPATGQVTVRAGTRLFDLNGLLAGLGRAQENMGDINHQSLAGAISTGTHGTGVTLGSLGTQVEAVRLVDGEGNLRTVTASDPQALSAARLSLGALGILTAVTLRTVPAYNLHMSISAGRFDEMLALAPEYARTHRHFEFYWIPYTNAVQVKRIQETRESARKSGPLQTFNDVVLENNAVHLLSRFNRRYPQATQAVCNVMGAAITPNTRTQASHQIFGSVRTVKFREMEYGLPATELRAALSELRDLMNRRRYPVSMPVEVRFARQDDILLSTANGRDVGYVAIHAFQGVPFSEYFRKAEQIFLAHGGRPHWGKCHTQTAADFAQTVPGFHEFLAVRDRFDPNRRFVNPYLQRVLGD